MAEMERRYRLMASLGVRNISGFNRKIKDAKKVGEPIRDPFGLVKREGKKQNKEQDCKQRVNWPLSSKHYRLL